MVAEVAKAGILDGFAAALEMVDTRPIGGGNRPI